MAAIGDLLGYLPGVSVRPVQGSSAGLSDHRAGPSEGVVRMCNACLSAMSRRFFVGAGMGTLAAAPLAGMAHAQPARAADTPDAALKLLLDGNARYVSNQLNERDFSASRAARVRGQAPFAAILG